MRTELLIDIHVPSVNGKGGMHRSHWSKKTTLINRWIYRFREQTLHQHSGRVRMTATRMSMNPRMDYDNLVACYKRYIDAIVRAGIIKEDSPKIIAQPVYEQVKALHKTQQRTIIIIEDL